MIKESLLELEGQYGGTRSDSMMVEGSCGSFTLFVWLVTISKLSFVQEDLLFNDTLDRAVLRQNYKIKFVNENQIEVQIESYRKVSEIIWKSEIVTACLPVQNRHAQYTRDLFHEWGRTHP